MLYYENGDLLDPKYKIIVQQVNCRGVMAAGLAKQIRNEYCNVYFEYYNALKYEGATLGHVCISHGGVRKTENGIINDQRIIVSMLAQDGYGTDKRYTDYDAFKKCLDVTLREIKPYSNTRWDNVAFPYKIGCGLGGGDWNVILPMLEEFSENTNKKVIIVRR